jgi:hypothetical protein
MINANQWTRLYTAYGKAILQTHVVEQRVALQVALWHGLKSSNEDKLFDEEAFSAKYSELRKAPFGKILKVGLSNGALSDEDGKEYEEYRKVRNLLVHDISDSISLRLFTKNDPENVIAELNQIAADLEEMNSEIMKWIELLFVLSGGDLAMAYKKV